MKIPLPSNETARLEALCRYNLLDSPPEETFDDFTKLAAQICETPIALMAVIERNRQCIKSKVGLAVTEIEREISFCTHTILQQDILIIRDTLANKQFTDNPLVIAEPYVRFYAGAPLITSEGYALGTLCVIDYVPRELSSQQLEILRTLSRQIVRQLELRRKLAQLEKTTQQRKETQENCMSLQLLHKEQAAPTDSEENIKQYKQTEKVLQETIQLQRAILDNSNYTIISTAADGTIVTFNAAAQRMLGYTAQEVVGKVTPLLIHDRQEVIQRAQELTQELGIPIEPGFECLVAKARRGEPDEREWTYIRKDVSRFPVLLTLTALRDAVGNITGFLCIGSDITERKLLINALRQGNEQEAGVRGAGGNGEIETRAQEQAVVARLGQRVLASIASSALMDEATRLIAQSLNVEYCEVLELTADGNALLLQSGVGWKSGYVGQTVVSTHTDSQAGYTLMTNQPVIVEDLRTERRFNDPALLQEHEVISSLSVVIPGSNRPFGVLGAHTKRKRVFNQEDIHFLETVAIILATAMERQQAEEELQRQNRRSQLFAEITLKIRQSLQLEEILQTTVTEIQNILKCDRVLLYRVWPNGSGRTVTEAVKPGWPAILDMSFPEEVFPLEYQELYRQGKVKAIADVEKAYAEVTPCLLEFMEPWCIKAKLMVPILMTGDRGRGDAVTWGRGDVGMWGHRGQGGQERQGGQGGDFGHNYFLSPPDSQSPRLWGLLIAHHCASPRPWSSFEIELLTQLSEQISLALAQSQLLDRETRQHLELARSNAELQEFAYVASHDLQEPLRKIQTFGDRLKTKYGDVLSGQGRDYLERMQNAAERMQALIDDLLTLSRVTTRAQPFVPTNLMQVVQDVLSDLEVRIQKTGGRIELDELPFLDADPVQMRQLLQNLLSNALKFHRDEEPPVIKIYSQLLPEAEQRATTGMNTGLTCQILIEDNGIGFEEKYLDRIFNAFQRLHGRGKYEGTGMGLAICRKIVERHEGSITAKSVPGHGSIFIVTLPLQQRQLKDEG